MRPRKLTDEQVRDIKRRLSNRQSFRRIAARFNVSVGTIQRIARSETYKDVKGQITGAGTRRFRKSQPSDQNPNAKLTYGGAIEIVRKFQNGSSIDELTKKFGVSRKTIYSVIEGRSWSLPPIEYGDRLEKFPDKELLSIDFHKTERPLPNSPEETQLIKKVFSAYRRYGYPYRSVRQQSLRGLASRVKEKAPIIVGDSINATTTTGLIELNAFHPYMDHVRRKGRISPYDVFSDDDYFVDAIRVQIRYGRRLTPSGIRSALSETRNSTQISAFRPTAACSIYNYFQSKNTLDYCAGWGGRMLGALANNTSYTGIDPNYRAIEANKHFLRLLNNENSTNSESNIRLICEAAEDILQSNVLSSQPFDLIFTSPPYFDLEEYSYERSQSFIRYPSYEEWLEKFLRATITKSSELLTTNGHLVLNVPNAMVNDTLSIVSKIQNMAFIKTMKMIFSHRRFTKANGKATRFEPLLVFNKVR